MAEWDGKDWKVVRRNQTMSQDSDLVLSIVSEMYSDYEITDVAYPEIANVQTLRLHIRTLEGQQGYITYYPADDDQLIMAVYVQEDGTLNDQKFEHMMETIIDVDKSKKKIKNNYLEEEKTIIKLLLCHNQMQMQN